MAGESEKPKAIPSWQQAATKSSDATNNNTKEEPESTDTKNDEMMDVARQFLKDESIRDAPRNDKVEFLKEKGLSDGEIDTLLAEDSSSSSELKTVHDTSDRSIVSETNTPAQPAQTPLVAPVAERSTSRSEMAPIITYPEFLLKPQKPPPLVTVSRLINAAYAIAGVSAMTWGASKYLIEPMLLTLTEARHDLADTTREDLDKLNEKLEGMVSHVPYIASAPAKAKQDIEEDTESIDSDPTELFHRDIAVQTTPGLSRSTSEVSLTRHTLDPTIAQSERLAGLSCSLRTLVTSLDHSSDNEKYLQDTVKDFQSKLDDMESSYSVLKNDYYGSGSLYSSASKDAKKGTRDNEAQKFKQEIRSLKGAFLSSRNFPTAPRPAATTGGYGAR